MTNPGSEGVIVVPKVTRAEWIAAAALLLAWKILSWQALDASAGCR